MTGRGVTVLLVEDEPALRRLIGSALASAGHRVLQASNGGQAIAAFDREGSSIDLLITDLEMPHVDGEALIAALRSRRRTLKVLCVSGKRQPHGAVDAFLAKPFTREAFLAKVHALVDGPQ